MSIIRNGETLYPATQWVKDLVSMYFAVWNCIRDEKTAKLLADLVTYPYFIGRFDSPFIGTEQHLYIAHNRADAFVGAWFHVREEDIFTNNDGLVVVYFLFTGMYQGNALPESAKDNVVAVHWHAYYALRWEQGKLSKRHWMLDGLYSVRNKQELLTQLGVPDWQGETNGEF